MPTAEPETKRDTQLELLLGSTLPIGVQIFEPQDVADLFIIDVKSVDNAFREKDEGQRLLGYSFNFSGSGLRRIKRIPRAMLIVWLMKNANYTLEVFRANVMDLCCGLSTRFLRIFVEIATAELDKRND